MSTTLLDDKPLICHYCQGSLKDAKFLPCLHSFCKACLLSAHSFQDVFSCPLCQSVVELKSGGIESLPMNTFYTNFADSTDSATESDINRIRRNEPGDKSPSSLRHNNGWTPGPITPTRSKALIGDSWSTNKLSNTNSELWKSRFNFNPLVQNHEEDLNRGWTQLGTNITADSVWSSPIGGNKHLCGCSDGQIVTSRCRDCADDLCNSCVEAHQRVKLTRDHVIVRYPTSETGTSTDLCSLPPPTPSLAVKADVMRVYAGVVEKAKGESEKYLLKAKQGMAQIEETKLLVSDMMSRVETRYGAILSEYKGVMTRYISALQDREQVTLLRLEKIRQVKLAALETQQNELNMSSLYLRKVAEKLTSCNQNGREMELIDSCTNAIETIRKVQNQCGTLSVQEDDIFEFTLPDSTRFNSSLSSFGFVGGSGFAPFSRAEGEGVKRAILGKDARFVVIVNDHLNEQRRTGGDPLKVTILAPDGRPVRQSLIDNKNGTYRVAWKPSIEGEHILAITLKDKHIQDSPFTVFIRSGRNYNDIGVMQFEFGREGENEGELCRPWGVSCSKEGNILVANRSNNRIEVFNKEGKYLYKFGTSGKLQGQFDRPASVSCDRLNRAIVSDKDNHRIQIFTVEGEFLMMFGEKGSKNGQFNYPWDVASNSKDQILVSDTRNHRIQLFTPNGEFLAKYGFEGAMWKHFDSPRGVAFTADDQAVVTDFNNHRLLVVKSDFNIAQFLGKEGADDGTFTRPNGVCVDEEGHIIVADSRNDRIQIFSSSGVFVSKFGSKGVGPGEFDRPSGICMSPEGQLIVVDFGNNRVQVF